MDVRNAPTSCMGYQFQQTRMINIIMCLYCDDPNDESLQFKHIKEEYDEDIYMKNGEEIVLYQEKYRTSDTNESFMHDVKNCGLTKVMISHFTRNNLKQINYEVFGTGTMRLCKNILFYQELLKNDAYINKIGKFLCLLMLGKISCVVKFSENIDKIDNIIE